MNYRRNIISGGIIFLFGAVYFLLSFQIPTFKGLGSTPIDARFVPQMWGVALMLLSSILLIRGFLERAKLLKASSKAASISWRNLLIKNREVILSFVVLAVYITLLKRVGFLLMSAAYVFVMVIILSPEGKKKALDIWADNGSCAFYYCRLHFCSFAECDAPSGYFRFLGG